MHELSSAAMDYSISLTSIEKGKKAVCWGRDGKNCRTDFFQSTPGGLKSYQKVEKVV